MDVVLGTVFFKHYKNDESLEKMNDLGLYHYLYIKRFSMELHK